MLAKLERFANKLAKEIGIKAHVTVKELTTRVDPKQECFAMWQGNIHTMWVRLRNPNGTIYTKRHFISCIVHELAHNKVMPHNDNFKREQRRISRVARKVCRVEKM